MSSYLVLARKYRPKSFTEVIGQEAVTAVLSGALEEGRIGHAYLLSGPRGTGKTTTARIFAKCLNCEQGPTPNPCGTCPRCEAADAGAEVDIIELDAASHTGVDTIRELRDEVIYAPMRARYKVYIVDEVHMLSKAAFNALLKTLEEPPAHVIFLFATTEPHKVLDTILSRCQLLRLNSLSEESIVSRLDEVFRLEGIEAESGVTREIARGARGGMRDALSIADQLLALAGDRPQIADLDRLGGDGGARRVEELFQAIEDGDKPRVLSLLAEIHGDEGQLTAALLAALRTAVVAYHCGENAPFLDAGESERKSARARAERLGAERLELWMQELLRARERMRLLPDQGALVLEVTLLDLARPERTIPLAELVERLEALESGGEVPRPAPAPAKTARVAPTAPTAQPQRSAPPPSAPQPASASSSVSSSPEELWKTFIAELGRTHAALSQLFDRSATPRLLESQGGGVYSLRLEELGARDQLLAEDRRNQAACARALRSVAGEKAELRLMLPEPSGDKPATAPQPRATEQKKEEKTKDTFTEQVADLFGGVIEEMP